MRDCTSIHYFYIFACGIISNDQKQNLKQLQAHHQAYKIKLTDADSIHDVIFLKKEKLIQVI